MRILYRGDEMTTMPPKRKQMSHTYILECNDGTFYTGSTLNLKKRIEKHQEEHDRIDDAFYREKQIQNWSHSKKKMLIAGDFSKVSELGKKRFDLE